MDKNVNLCSALEFITAHPRLTKSPKEEETFLYVFFCIGASISIGREIQCLPHAGFFLCWSKDTFRSRYVIKLGLNIVYIFFLNQKMLFELL